MELLEFSLLVVIPLLVLFSLIMGIFLTGKQQRQRTREHAENFRIRYGNRLNKRLEDKKRVWAMFGLTYTGEEEEEVGKGRQSDEESPPPNYSEALRTQAYRPRHYGTLASSLAADKIKIQVPSPALIWKTSVLYTEDDDITRSLGSQEPLSPTRLNSVHRTYSKDRG